MKNKGSKRIQIDKNQATTFAVVAIAAVVTVMALMVSRGLWSQSRYLGKVIDKKTVALNQLESNKEAVASLTESYNDFDNKDPNLIGGKKEGLSELDGSNGTLVLDALPNSYDFPALASSIERLLAGYDVESISGSDDALAQQGSSSADAVEMPFAFEVNTSYDGAKELINKFDKSIRPFSITKIELTGSNASLKANLSVKTYYQSNTSLKITEETVQ